MTSTFRKLFGNLYFGWWILAASVCLQILLMGLLTQSFGVFAAVWQDEFGWSATVVASVFSAQQITGGFLSPVQGWLLVRFRPRVLIQIGVLLVAASLLALSTVKTLPMMIATFLVLGIGLNLAGPMSQSTVLVRWFERYRTLVLAVMQLGKGIGGLLAPILVLLFAWFGWRTTAIVAGFATLLIGGGAAALMRSRPEEFGLLPDGRSRRVDDFDRANLNSSHYEGPQAEGLAPRAILRTPTFWAIVIGHAACAAIVTAILVHLVRYVELQGFGLDFGAALLALVTATMMVGLVVGGIVGDRMNKGRLAACAAMLHLFALLALLIGEGQSWLFAFAILHGTAWGVRDPLMQALRAQYYGTEAFPSLEGYSRAIVTLGMIIGPLLVGLLTDTTGSYDSSLVSLAVLAALAALLFQFASRPPRTQTTS